MSTGESTDIENLPPQVGAHCDHPDCAYGGQSCSDIVNRRRYKCTKCSGESGVMTLCNDCHGKGAHYRHRKYFEILTD